MIDLFALNFKCFAIVFKIYLYVTIMLLMIDIQIIIYNVRETTLKRSYLKFERQPLTRS